MHTKKNEIDSMIFKGVPEIDGFLNLVHEIEWTARTRDKLCNSKSDKRELGPFVLGRYLGVRLWGSNGF